MQIHFSQVLKLNESKKEIISSLVCQRIKLLIGERKASYIENVFFCDTLPRDVLSLSNLTNNHNLSHHIGLSKDRGKANIYCASQMIYSLIRQAVESPSFDDAIMAVSRELSAIVYP